MKLKKKKSWRKSLGSRAKQRILILNTKIMIYKRKIDKSDFIRIKNL